MDNETTKGKIPSNSIERIVIYVTDIIEKIIQSENSPFMIDNHNYRKKGNYIKIFKIFYREILNIYRFKIKINYFLNS